jgi:hypothetical protein
MTPEYECAIATSPFVKVPAKPDMQVMLLLDAGFSVVSVVDASTGVTSRWRKRQPDQTRVGLVVERLGISTEAAMTADELVRDYQ